MIVVRVVIDSEPARSSDPAPSLAEALQAQNLAVRASSMLQSLPGEDICLLCDKVVEEVQKLTGYDRVMVYMFYKDDHGEVVSEIMRPIASYPFNYSTLDSYPMKRYRLYRPIRSSPLKGIGKAFLNLRSWLIYYKR
ncbi:hypothetical protein TanjilG_07029 [Lupinus angustifolius]|uniref:Phytochrome chromophore attachment site domain-containing protein n=1 Tax=Lupinus angustifolius TaxID=3871 RepID=A0A4P1QXI5_LUPAN|nr:hypothetical protein TanjilG_07029 [Lupinus angustifolius]